MNNEQEYEEMIRLEQSTCEIILKPKKTTTRRKKSKTDTIKDANEKLEDSNLPIETVETSEPVSAPEEVIAVAESDANVLDTPVETVADNVVEQSSVVTYNFPKREEKHKPTEKKFDVISAQIIAIFALVITILLTNIFWEDSGMNTLIRQVFNPTSNKEKSYKDFSVNSPSDVYDEEVGVMTVSSTGAIYAPCEGTVTAVNKNTDGTYNFTIIHSPSFSTKISNVSSVYFSEGQSVYKSTPVCYSTGSSDVTVEFYSNGELIKDYKVTNGVIEWQA